MKRSVVATGLAVLEATALIAIAAVLFIVRGSSPASGSTWGSAAAAGLPPLALCAYPLVGGLVAVRRKGNPIGWLLLVSGLSWVLAFSIDPFKRLNVHFTLEGPAGALLYVWQLGWWVPALGLTATLMLQLFPDGSPLSPRWRKVAVASVVSLGLVLVAATLGTDAAEGGSIANPYASPALRPVAQALGPLLFLFPLTIATSVASLVVRYRRSGVDERQQIKWVAFAGAILAAIYGAALIASIAAERPDGSFPAPVAVLQDLTLISYAAIPAAIGIAVLRYRLYEIEKIISRTIAYGVVIGTLGGSYLGLVLLLGAASRSLTGGTDVAVATSTLAVAALFRPVLRRVQSRVERRFDRVRYDAARAVERFGARLRDDIGMEEITDELHAMVGRSLRPTTVSLWINPRTTRRVDRG